MRWHKRYQWLKVHSMNFGAIVRCGALPEKSEGNSLVWLFCDMSALTLSRRGNQNAIINPRVKKRWR
jgi:hypothetical protein